MTKPTITINGKEIEIKTKARLWRVVAEFNEKRRKKEIATDDFVDEHCKVIATAYGVSVDDVLDNIDIADVLPTCLEVLNYTGDKLTSKMLKKNQDESEI